MHLQKLTFLTICMGMAAMAAPQAQQLQAQPQAQASAPVAQSRDAPVYSDTQYAASGYQQAGAASAGQYAQGATAAYSQPQAQYAAAASTQGGYGGQPAGGNNAGYYYYYYPVQESKTDYAPQKEQAYHPADSYGIDPLGIISVLAIAGLVIAGLALLFPGWAYVKSDENVYYRSNNGSPSLLGLNKEDFLTLTSLVLAAIEGEDCVEKMMCDASKLVKKVKKADTFLRFMEDFAPTSVSGNIKKLRTAMKKSDECKNLSCGKKKASSPPVVVSSSPAL